MNQDTINFLIGLIDQYGVSVTVLGFTFWFLVFKLWPFAQQLVLRQLDEMKDERKQSQEERQAFLKALERRDNELDRISLNFSVINESIKRLNTEMVEIKNFVIETVNENHKRKRHENKPVAEEKPEVKPEEVKNESV